MDDFDDPTLHRYCTDAVDAFTAGHRDWEGKVEYYDVDQIARDAAGWTLLESGQRDRDLTGDPLFDRLVAMVRTIIAERSG